MQRRSEFIDASQKANKTKTVKVREKIITFVTISSDHRLIFRSTISHLWKGLAKSSLISVLETPLHFVWNLSADKVRPSSSLSPRVGKRKSRKDEFREVKGWGTSPLPHVKTFYLLMPFSFYLPLVEYLIAALKCVHAWCPCHLSVPMFLSVFMSVSMSISMSVLDHFHVHVHVHIHVLSFFMAVFMQYEHE
jgi:hypothetical protein